jgi:hypothetical protein
MLDYRYKPINNFKHLSLTSKSDCFGYKYTTLGSTNILMRRVHFKKSSAKSDRIALIKVIAHVVSVTQLNSVLMSLAF